MPCRHCPYRRRYAPRRVLLLATSLRLRPRQRLVHQPPCSRWRREPPALPRALARLAWGAWRLLEVPPSLRLPQVLRRLRQAAGGAKFAWFLSLNRPAASPYREWQERLVCQPGPRGQTEPQVWAAPARLRDRAPGAWAEGLGASSPFLAQEKAVRAAPEGREVSVLARAEPSLFLHRAAESGSMIQEV